VSGRRLLLGSVTVDLAEDLLDPAAAPRLTEADLVDGRVVVV